MTGTKRSSVWFHEIPGKEAVAYANEVCDLAIMPLGAIEQHGQHGPIRSDSYNPIGICKRIAEKSGAPG